MSENNVMNILVITTFTIYIILWTTLTIGLPVYFTFIGKISGWWILGGFLIYESHVSPESWRKLIRWEKKSSDTEYSIE